MLTELVARDMASLQPVLNDKTIKVFIKGKDKRADIETALRVYRKDFSLEKFGLVLP
jgi:hypothetical protein